jgi:hypothetical protein
MHAAGQRIAGREDVGKTDRMNPASRGIAEKGAGLVAAYITELVAVVPRAQEA